MSLLLGSGFSPSTLLCRSDWWSAAEMVAHLEGSPFSTEQCWSSVGLSIRYLFISLTKASSKSRGAFKLLPFMDNGDHCVHWDLECCKIISVRVLI